MIPYNIRRGRALGIAFGITALVMLLAGGASAFSNDGGGSWLYYRDLTINNAGGALSDYQVLVSLSGADFPANAKADGADVRFTDAGGAELPCWIESWGGGSAKVWVKVPNIPAGGSTIRMYYGNPSASSSSNEANVFLFSDEFEGNTLKPQWTSWTTGDGSVTVADGLAKLDQASSDFNVAWMYGSSYNLPSNNIIFTTRRKLSSSFTEDDHILLENSAGGHFQIYSRTGYWDPQWHGCFGNGDIRCDWETNVPLSNTVDTNFHVFDIAIANGKVDFYIDNVYKNSITATLNGNLRPLFTAEFGWANVNPGQYTLVDYVRVRKYASPEPSVSVGAEMPIALEVVIDIKPGSFPNSIKLGSEGNVPVAILSDATFDARTVNVSTVTLAGAPVKLKKNGTPMSSIEDVNGDGLLDMVVHVNTKALQLTATDTEAILEGKTVGGTPIRGKDSVRIVPP